MTGQARMAAVSGGVFAVLLVVALVLVETGPKLDDPDSRYTSFYTNGSGGTLVTLGVYVVPFAGIAFLWHVVATRTLLQVIRPGSWADPAHWLQLASGLVFVCMLFGASAAVGAVALLTRFSVHPLPPPDVARSLSAVGYGLAFVFGVRAAGMYMIATTRLASRAGVLPRAVALVSYVVAALLLVSTTFHPAILLVFPAWVLTVSIVLLVRRPTDPIP